MNIEGRHEDIRLVPAQGHGREKVVQNHYYYVKPEKKEQSEYYNFKRGRYNKKVGRGGTIKKDKEK